MNTEPIKNYPIIFLDLGGVMINNAQLHYFDPPDIDALYAAMNEAVLKRPQYKSILNSCSVQDVAAMLYFDKTAVNCVARLCEDYQAKIVLTSLWRVGKFFDELQALFSLIDLDHAIISTTRRLDNLRVEEISRWLMENSEWVKSFVILDDIDNGLSAKFPKRFVFCPHFFNQELYAAAARSLALPFKEEEIY